jgi:hypothetical protein
MDTGEGYLVVVEELDDGPGCRRSEGRLADRQTTETDRVGAVDVLVGDDVADEVGGDAVGQGVCRMMPCTSASSLSSVRCFAICRSVA